MGMNQVLLEQANLRPKRTWGQNFCQDDSVLSDLVQAAQLQPGDVVVELGAGLGALTAMLVRHPVHVVAVERDRELIPILTQRFAQPRCTPSLPLPATVSDTASTALSCTILEQDAHRLDYAELQSQAQGSLKVAGNLPYHLASRLMVQLAEASSWVDTSVLMVQREVAQRAMASVGGKIYGLLSLLLQRYCHIRWIRDVPPHCFYPPPKVHSTIIALVPHHQHPLPHLDRELVGVMRALFHQRRKQIRNTLASYCPGSSTQHLACFAQACIDPTARPEQLTLEDFARLTAVLADRGGLPLQQRQRDGALSLSTT